MEGAAYKLNEYQITEDEGGLLWWKAHSGFGAQRRGMCLIHDDILIMGPCRHEETGFLKREFLDLLERLPLWDKTEYYCFASELLDVASGRSLDQNFLEQVPFPVNLASTPAGPTTDASPGTFRLDKYQIKVTADGQIAWQSCGRLDRVLSGQCLIQSGVLFLGPEEREDDENGKAGFLKKLGTLPPWDRTKIWSRSLALRPCRAHPEKGRPIAGIEKEAQGQPEWESDHTLHEKPAEECAPRRSVQFRSLWSSRFRSFKKSLPYLYLPLVFRFRKQSWSVFRIAKLRLTWLILIVMAGLLLGLILSLHSVEERFHRFHSPEKHHRR